jgi:hypothetical protein
VVTKSAIPESNVMAEVDVLLVIVMLVTNPKPPPALAAEVNFFKTNPKKIANFSKNNTNSGKVVLFCKKNLNFKLLKPFSAICGNGLRDSGEQCDGGANCNADCQCQLGFEPESTTSFACKGAPPFYSHLLYPPPRLGAFTIPPSSDTSHFASQCTLWKWCPRCQRAM